MVAQAGAVQCHLVLVGMRSARNRGAANPGCSRLSAGAFGTRSSCRQVARLASRNRTEKTGVFLLTVIIARSTLSGITKLRLPILSLILLAIALLVGPGSTLADHYACITAWGDPPGEVACRVDCIDGYVGWYGCNVDCDNAWYGYSRLVLV